MGDQLKKLTLRGFKSIKEIVDFEFQPINVLIGENGAGKSNFVSFFRFLSWMLASPGNLQGFVSTHGFASSFLYDGPRSTPQMEADLEFHTAAGINEYAFRLFHGAPDNLIFAEEKYRYTSSKIPGRPPWRQLGSSHAEARLIQDAEKGDQTARFILRFLNRCKVFQFHNTSETSRIRLGWSVADNRYLKEDGANLGAVLYRLREEQPTYYKRTVDVIRQVLPFFADFELSPSGDSLLLQWRERGSDMVFGPHQASDGGLRAMALFTLLLLPSENLPEVIILDEPELGLHPAAISTLAGLLHAVSRQKQVIVATQSMTLLDYFEPEEIVVVERAQGPSTFKRLNRKDLADWLDRYSMSQLWEKNVIGGTP